MLLGGGERLARSMVFNSFYANSATSDTLSTQSPILLPPPPECSSSHSHSTAGSATSACSASTKRNSKGVQALPMVRKLMSSRRNWFPISSAMDYHFPGQFHHCYPANIHQCCGGPQPNIKVFNPWPTQCCNADDLQRGHACCIRAPRSKSLAVQ